MSGVQILLLVLGAVMFILSFVLPERKDSVSGEIKKISERQIRELVEKEMQDLHDRVSDIVDETIAYAVEKSERSMEKLTNEKIMSINEYSDTVLEDIHKNHEEVVFLYDMLNDKHKDLTSVASEVERTARKAKNVVNAVDNPMPAQAPIEAPPQRPTPGFAPMVLDMNSAEAKSIINPHSQENAPGTVQAVNPYSQEGVRETAQVVNPYSQETVAGVSQAINPYSQFTPSVLTDEGMDLNINPGVQRVITPAGFSNNSMEPGNEAGVPVNEKTVQEPQKGKRGRKPKAKSESTAEETPVSFPVTPKNPVALSFQGSGDESRNNNQRILELHRAGKSNVAIARELGLGIGEVKLVIDLFK